MAALILALLTAPANADDCADPIGVIQSAEVDAVNFYLNDAETGLAKAVDAIGCSDKVDAETVARLWQTRGMVHMLKEDDAEALRAFAASKRADASVWNEDYGDKAKELWSAAASESGEPLELGLRGVSEGDWVLLDGHESSSELDLTPGLYLLQVGHADAARFARVVEISGSDDLVVSVPGRDGQTMAMADTQVAAKARSGPRLAPLVGAGVAAIVAGGATFMASQERKAFFEGGQFNAAESAAHYRKTNTYTIIGIGAGAASVGLVTVSIAF